MDTLQLIREFLKDRTGIAPDKVVMEAPLEKVGVDSLMLLELVFEVETCKGIKLPTDFGTPSTVGDLVRGLDSLCLQPA